MSLLLALSQLPIVLLFSYIYARDNHEREPLRILFYCFLGGILTFPAAAAIEYALELYILPHEYSPTIVHGVQMFFGVALVEEGCKLIALLLIAYRKPEFNEPFDGIIYAVAVSLGLAAIENALYCFQFGIGVAWLRMFSAVPMHAMSAVLLGFYVGRAKFEPDARKAKYFIWVGLIASTLAHGSYNFFLALEMVEYLPVALFLLVVQIMLAHRAMRIYNLQRGISTGSTCLYLPEQDRDLFITPLSWAVFSLSLFCALEFLWSVAAASGAVSGDMLQLNHEEMVHAGMLGLLGAIVAFKALCALKKHRGWGWNFAFITFVVALPSPLFVLSVAGLFGLLHPRTRQCFVSIKDPLPA